MENTTTTNRKELMLISSDEQDYSIDIQAAEGSVLLKGLIADYAGTNKIPLPDVRGDILKIIVEYLEHYKDNVPREIRRPLISQNLYDVADEWDVKFMQKISLNDTIELINSSNYLDIRSLLDLSCAKIASIMMEKPVDEVRTLFGIECDMTPEEVAEYEKYPIV